MEDNIFSYEGRIRRRTYWVRWLIVFLITFILRLAAIENEVMLTFYLIVALLGMIFILMQGIKRMHDVDKSGWYLLIPFYNLVLALTDGTPGPNQYGNDPKGRESNANLGTLDSNLSDSGALDSDLFGSSSFDLRRYESVFIYIGCIISFDVLFWTCYQIFDGSYSESVKYASMFFTIAIDCIPLIIGINIKNKSMKTLFIILGIITLIAGIYSRLRYWI